MNTKEKNFSNTLKKYLLANKYLVNKIETRMTAGGIPDLLVASPNGYQGFMELKVVEDDYKLSLTKSQLAFYATRKRCKIEIPIIALIEPLNKMMCISSYKALDICVLWGGKLELEGLPERLFFDRTKAGYAELLAHATDLLFYSGRVYK